MPRTADEIMLRMGFPETETGPYVTQLRALIAEQVKHGLVDHSSGTWAPGRHSAETRAKALLGMHWAMDRGHHCRVECIDGLRGWRRRGDGKLKHPNLIPWLQDKWRETIMQLRVARDRYILRIRNPYQ